MSNFTFIRFVRRVANASDFDWFVISSPEKDYDIFVSFYSEPQLSEGDYVINPTITHADKGKVYIHIRENISDKCALFEYHGELCLSKHNTNGFVYFDIVNMRQIEANFKEEWEELKSMLKKDEYRYTHLPELKDSHLRQHIVVFSGAGMSAESGLSTYRDEHGLWKEYDWEKLASASAFYENPEPVLEFANMLIYEVLKAEPNHAHRLIAELEKWHDVTIITQNVDDLHERAGSTNVIHLHGELTKVTSSDNRTNPDCIKDLPLDIPIRVGDKATDGSQLRPYIVWFGEYVMDFDKAADIVRNADIFVVIGTSLTVQPAASLIRYAHPEVPRFIINPSEAIIPNDGNIPDGYVHIREKATIGVETFIDRLIELC